MVDRIKRDFLIEKFSELIAGKITNLEYDNFEQKIVSDDPALWLIWEKTWYLYDDFKEHKIKLTTTQQFYFARCMLFLNSDLEYEWPYPTLMHNFKRIITILTLGLFPCFREPEYSKLGDFHVWPFFREKDFKNAIKNKKLSYRKIIAFFNKQD